MREKPVEETLEVLSEEQIAQTFQSQIQSKSPTKSNIERKPVRSIAEQSEEDIVLGVEGTDAQPISLDPVVVSEIRKAQQPFDLHNFSDFAFLDERDKAALDVIEDEFLAELARRGIFNFA